MESTQSNSGAPGLPRKPLDNPPRPKPTYATDDECAALLAQVLALVPSHLACSSDSTIPLLEALKRLDVQRGTDVARSLIFISAAIHRSADERRIAEYILRSRRVVEDGSRSPLALVRGARCAAEMDLRRIHRRETPTPNDALSGRAADSIAAQTESPSVGEIVIDKLRIAIGRAPTEAVRGRLLDAVSIALELADRHVLNGGAGPSLLGMRTDARVDARLVTHLKGEFDNVIAARNIARLLVGGDEAPIEAALLFWCTRSPFTASDIPELVRKRWAGCLRLAETALAASSSESGSSVRESSWTLDPIWIARLESDISERRPSASPVARRTGLRPNVSCGRYAG